MKRCDAGTFTTYDHAHASLQVSEDEGSEEEEGDEAADKDAAPAAASAN